MPRAIWFAADERALIIISDSASAKKRTIRPMMLDDQGVTGESADPFVPWPLLVWK